MKIPRVFGIGTVTVVTLALVLPVFLAGCVTKNRDVQVSAPVVETRREPPHPGPRIDGNPDTRPLFNYILFPFDSTDILPEGKVTLDKVCKLMKKYTYNIVLFEGHASDEGPEEYNMALGLRRAEAAKAYLVENGISAERIKVKSYGESEPVFPNDGPYRANNRRVVVDYRWRSQYR